MRKKIRQPLLQLYGIENAREEAVKLTDKAMKILGRFDNNEFLIELTKYLLDRNY